MERKTDSRGIRLERPAETVFRRHGTGTRQVFDEYNNKIGTITRVDPEQGQGHVDATEHYELTWIGEDGYIHETTVPDLDQAQTFFDGNAWAASLVHGPMNDPIAPSQKRGVRIVLTRDHLTQVGIVVGWGCFGATATWLGINGPQSEYHPGEESRAINEAIGQVLTSAYLPD